MVVGLDIGTSNVRVVIGETDVDGRFRIIGTASEKSSGMRNGNIVNIEAASNVIRKAIENAEQNGGVDVHSVITDIGGEQIEGLNTTGKVAISKKGRGSREVDADDVRRVKESAFAIKIPDDREILCDVCQEFTVDDNRGVKDPINQIGYKLEGSFHIISASRTTLQNIKSSVGRAGYFVDTILPKTLACSYSVVTKDERDLGSIIIDLGAGTTDILVILNDSPVFTDSVPVGGNMITQDIYIEKGISLADAETLKIQSGSCWMENINPDETVIVNGLGGRPPQEFPRSELCEIITARMEEILMIVRDKIMEGSTITRLAGNIILTGGGANLDGIVELVQDVFGTSAVRVGFPEKMGGIEEDYAGPEWDAAVGLVIYGRGRENSRTTKRTKKAKVVSSEKTGNLENIKKIIKKFF